MKDKDKEFKEAARNEADKLYGHAALNTGNTYKIGRLIRDANCVCHYLGSDKQVPMGLAAAIQDLGNAYIALCNTFSDEDNEEIVKLYATLEQHKKDQGQGGANMMVMVASSNGNN